MRSTVPLNRVLAGADVPCLRRAGVLLLAIAAAATAGCRSGGDLESVTRAPATTTTATTSPTVPASFPATIPPPPVPAGGGDVLNVHSRLFPYSPGQTSWTSTSGAVTVSVRIDPPTPKAGEPVAFDILVSSASVACCGVLLHPGDNASLEGGSGLACLPGEAPGDRTATFRLVHAYQTSGRFSFRVTARSGTCSEAAGTAGLTGFVEVA